MPSLYSDWQENLKHPWISKYFVLFFVLMNVLLLAFLYHKFLINKWYGTFYFVAIERFDIHLITHPLIYVIGLPLYILAGLPALFIISLIFFSVGWYYIQKIVWDGYKFLTPFLYFIFFIRPAAANWVMFFSRDNLLFMFSAIFAYYFYLTWIKDENHWLKLIILAVLAIYTKSSAFIFITPLFTLFLLKNVGLWIANGAMFGIPVFRESWLYSAWWVDVKKAASTLFNLRVIDIAFLFPNKVFFIFPVMALIVNSPVAYSIVFSTIFAGVIIHNMGPQFYDLEVVWRYTYMAIPLNIIVLGEATKKVWRWWQRKGSRYLPSWLHVQ